MGRGGEQNRISWLRPGQFSHQSSCPHCPSQGVSPGQPRRAERGAAALHGTGHPELARPARPPCPIHLCGHRGPPAGCSQVCPSLADPALGSVQQGQCDRRCGRGAATQGQLHPAAAPVLVTRLSGGISKKHHHSRQGTLGTRSGPWPPLLWRCPLLCFLAAMADSLCLDGRFHLDTRAFQPAHMGRPLNPKPR